MDAGLRRTKNAIGLTRTLVVRAAIALIDDKGLDRFSTRELARRLGVYPAAIYWHVGGDREELFSEISAEITVHLMSPVEAFSDWRDTIRTVFRRYRSAVHRHPNVAPLLGAQMRSNGAANAAWVEVLLNALREAGYEGVSQVDAFNALIGGLSGYVTMELAPGPTRDIEGWSQRFNAALDEVSAEDFPLTVQMLPQMRDKAFVLRCKNGSQSPLDGGFELLLDALIGGLERGSGKPAGS